MKKKVIFAIATGLFVVATVFNMNVLQTNNACDVSLESIAVMAQAEKESAWKAFTNSVKDWWDSNIYDCKPRKCTYAKYTSYVGAGTGVGASATASSGYTYDHDDGKWYETSSVNASVGYGVSIDVNVTKTYVEGEEEYAVGGSSVAHVWNCKSCS
jgi:hypothetical protein